MTIQRAETFNPNNMESYLAYARARKAEPSNIQRIGINEKGKEERGIKTGDVRAAALTAVKNVVTPADATITALVRQINALQAPAEYSEAQAGGGVKTVISGREGMEILEVAANGKKAKDTDLLADGTKIVTEYNKDGEPAKRFTTNSDGTENTPEHYNAAEERWQEGDPVPINDGRTTTQSYRDPATGVSKQYKQTIQKLSDGSTTRITIKSANGDGEEFTLDGKVDKHLGLHASKLTEVTSSKYLCPEKKLKITTEGNVTKIEDGKKGVDITMTSMSDIVSADHGERGALLKIQYDYKEGPVESSTIIGFYRIMQGNGQQSYNTCVDWSAAKDVTEQVKFRDEDRVVTIKYTGNGNGPISISGDAPDDDTWKDALGISGHWENALKHLSPTTEGFSKDYAHPFKSIDSLA